MQQITPGFLTILVHLLLVASVSGFGVIKHTTVEQRTHIAIPSNSRRYSPRFGGNKKNGLVVHNTNIEKTTSLRSTPDDDDDSDDDDESSINVLGTRMECCCANVRDSGIGTGFYRNGYCSTGAQDVGRHTVCVRVSEEFLEFSKSVGNDLSTPVPEYSFPGLKDGDVWCLCAQRWAQAYQNGKAPKLYLRATHEKTLDYVDDFAVLRSYALDGDEADEEKGELDEKRDRLEKLFGRSRDDSDSDDDDEQEDSPPSSSSSSSEEEEEQ